VNGLEVTSPFSSAPPSPDSPMQTAAATDLLYSTYLGGPGHLDSSRDIAVDSAGHAYVTGLAYPGFPSTPGVFDPTIDGVFSDAFIAKLNPDGNGLIYATFLGGNDFDAGQGISLDEAGNAFVVGYTTSPNFPTTPGAFDSTLTDEADAFVAKLNADGTALNYATLLGGSSNLDFGLSITSDALGYAYVAGFTQAADFPTTAEVSTAGYFGGWTDAFAAKINLDGSALVYSMLLGGSDSDYSYAIALDEAGNAYLTGYTFSSDFQTTPGALDTTLASTDAFLVKLNAGGELAYATLLGGSGGDFGYALAVDTTGHAYLSGFTDSTDFPVTPGAFDTSFNTGYSGDAFVAKVSPNGSGLVYATYLGGNHHEYGEDLVVDATGSVYLTGSTGSVDFPSTPGAFDTACAGCNQTFPYPDVFVTKLHPSGGLAYSTFLGGDDNYDHSYGLALGGIDQVYVSGDTNSTNFPVTPGAFDSSLDGFDDAFVSKLRLQTGSEPPPLPVPAHSCAPTLLGTVTVGNRPRSLAVDSARQRVYVANFDSNSVSIVNSQTNQVIQTIPNIASANDIAHDPTHNLIWVSNYLAGQVTPIQANDDATSFTVLPSLTVGVGPWGVAYDKIHDFIYVVNSQADSVTVINAASRTVVATISGKFNQPFLAAANPVTGKVYVTNFGSHSVTVLDGTSVSRVVDLYDSS
ncbi:MAG TPA: SBBP repeat-containing protein, partial [Anaerolineae bacterium]|nr:SBBP repeat-containing protein [Anaerolineae bacterium]